MLEEPVDEPFVKSKDTELSNGEVLTFAIPPVLPGTPRGALTTH
jgi:hypothetical protein